MGCYKSLLLGTTIMSLTNHNSIIFNIIGISSNQPLWQQIGKFTATINKTFGRQTFVFMPWTTPCEL